jgi:hypothetical protein
MKEQLIFKAFMEGVCRKFGIADAIAPLSKGFDTFCESEEWHGAPMDWRSEYDDGKINTHENSADGFFATPREPIGYAILNNDTNALRDLHMGSHEVNEPWNASGYSEDFNKEGEFHYDFANGYSQEFEEDWHRVVGTTDNQEALVKMLEYVPDFWLCRADFINAFHAGYNKGLLAKLLRNYPNPDDTENNYLEWDGVTIPEVLSFLEQDDGSVHLLRESVEDYGDGPVEIDNFPSLLASHLEAGTLRDYVIADGKTAISDLKALDAFMTENGFGKVGDFDFDSETTINWHPAFGDATGTVRAVCYPGVWEPLAPKYEADGSVHLLRESVEDYGAEFVKIDDFPVDLVAPLSNGTVGDFVQYYGKNAIEDLKNLDAFMTQNGLCGINPPDNKEWEESYNSYNSRPAFGKATNTVMVYGVKGQWEPLAPEYEAEFAETETPADSFYESASGASKSKWLRRIYNVAEPFTSHVYRDDNWSNVMDLFKTLREQVPEVKFTFGVTDGGYCCPGEDGMPRRKTYDVKATTPEGFDLVGSLHCDAAGSVEDPFDQYDMTLVLN